MEYASQDRGKSSIPYSVFDVHHVLQTAVAKCMARDANREKSEKPLFYRRFRRPDGRQDRAEGGDTLGLNLMPAVQRSGIGARAAKTRHLLGRLASWRSKPQQCGRAGYADLLAMLAQRLGDPCRRAAKPAKPTQPRHRLGGHVKAASRGHLKTGQSRWALSK